MRNYYLKKSKFDRFMVFVGVASFFVLVYFFACVPDVQASGGPADIGVPAITAQQFSDVASEVAQTATGSDEASIIWQILSGQGTWGALLFALVGLIWKFAKPYLDQWVALKRLETLYTFAQTAVKSTSQTLVDNLRAKSEDGKLTKEEAKESMDTAKDVFIALCKTQGIDVVKEYGMEFIEWLIEKFVGESKELAAIAPFSAQSWVPTPKTVQAAQQPPLPDLPR